MIEIKVHNPDRNGDCKCEMTLKGPKDIIITNMLQCSKRFIDTHLNPVERMAYIKTLIDIT